MKHAFIVVRATRDEETGAWVAASNDIAGLAVEAETVEALKKKVVVAISDLIELNGTESDLPEIPVYIMAEHLAKIPNPAYELMRRDFTGNC